MLIGIYIYIFYIQARKLIRFFKKIPQNTAILLSEQIVVQIFEKSKNFKKY